MNLAVRYKPRKLCRIKRAFPRAYDQKAAAVKQSLATENLAARTVHTLMVVAKSAQVYTIYVYSIQSRPSDL